VSRKLRGLKILSGNILEVSGIFNLEKENRRDMLHVFGELSLKRCITVILYFTQGKHTKATGKQILL
jgi:hypothetical protein